ncbi:MAG: hypothetical protein ACI89X_004654, partial [Planctomycetota bacterium]
AACLPPPGKLVVAWCPEIEPRSFRAELANSGSSMTNESLTVLAV